jgi:hypothetical protein
MRYAGGRVDGLVVGANAPPASHLSPVCSQPENLARGPDT